ncbi:MAG: hypothetical protein GXO28_07170 [Methanopyri archaeon]|nr:hypothetical protein [Methanopyri archaeon]
MTDYSQIFEQCRQLLDERIIQDDQIPRNVRRAAKKAIEILEDEGQSPGVRASTAISTLEEVVNDQNTPEYARPVLLQVIAALEQVRDEV